MTRHTLRSHVVHLIALVAMMVWGGMAQAQASRTWVSAVGDDANPCSRTAPCKTFAGAIAKTAAGGEIDALDAGDFGAVTITKAITLDGGAGHVAGLMITGSTSGITIDANLAQDDVILRNLSLNGFNQAGLNGVRIVGAKTVAIDNVAVTAFSDSCVLVESTAVGTLVDISQSTLTLCGNGLKVAGSATVNVGDSRALLNTANGLALTDTQGTLYTANVFVQANATNLVQASFTGPTPAFASVSAGSASATITGGPGCGFASAGFLAPSSLASGGPASPVQAGFGFTTNNCGAGATVTVTLTYEQAMPPGTTLYKYNATTATWFTLSGVVLSSDRKRLTYQVTDNGVGDANAASGIITDPVLPAVAVEGIPTLSEGGLLALLALMGMSALAALHRSPPGRPAA
ncbi:MAG: hypothetical protein KDG55_05860 [Rhodocyclaceae bacterium]|nr:hypothetical protein [Rhodocyclaceae bacterium]